MTPRPSRPERDRTSSIAAWALLGAFASLLAARGGKVFPAALAVQAALLAGAGAALWRGAFPLPPDLPLPLTALAVLQTCSALLSGAPEGAFLSLGRFWSAPAFAVLAASLWGADQWKAFGALFLTVAAGQALLAPGGREALLLLPGNPQYGALWMTAALLLLPGMDGLETRWKRLLGALLSAGVLMSSTRSALAAVAAGGLYWSARRFGFRGAAVFALGLLAAATLLPRVAWEGILKVSDAAAWKRWDIWAAAGRGILARPWLGWGPGQFEGLYRLHGLPQEGGPARFDHSTLFAHNDYLQLAAASGLPALFLFLWAAWAVFRAGVRGRPAPAAAATAAAVFACFNFPFALPVNVLAAGALAAFLLPRPADGARASARPLGGFLLVLAAWPLALFPSSLRRGPADRPFYGRAADFLARSEALSAEPAGREESERLALRALRSAPARAEAWRHWAALQAASGQTDGAADALRHALARHPHNAPWWVDLGVLEESLGRPEAAAAAFHQALRIEPHYAEAAFRLGRLMRLRGEGTKARAWLERLLREDHPSPPPDASPYARRVLAWDAGAVRGEFSRCLPGRKDIIAPR